jgi:hypothetical protein
MTALDLLDHALPATAPAFSPEKPRQSLRKLLLPLFRRVAESSYAWRAESVGHWDADGTRHWMPRLVFKRPGETPDFKVGIFAGVHGDEPAGVFALCDFVRALDDSAVRGRGYELHVYPLVNPTGYEDGTRHSRSGKDLNREFWRGSNEPEVALLEKEILLLGICFRARRTGNGQNADWRQGVRGYMSFMSASPNCSRDRAPIRWKLRAS